MPSFHMHILMRLENFWHTSHIPRQPWISHRKFPFKFPSRRMWCWEKVMLFKLWQREIKIILKKQTFSKFFFFFVPLESILNAWYHFWFTWATAGGVWRIQYFVNDVLENNFQGCRNVGKKTNKTLLLADFSKRFYRYDGKKETCSYKKKNAFLSLLCFYIIMKTAHLPTLKLSDRIPRGNY
jgi:hypothetical protein